MEATAISVLERLKLATKSQTDGELADKLKLTKQSIAQAKAKKNIPSSWVQKTAEIFDVSADWLFFGRGPMHPLACTDSSAAPQDAVPNSAAKPACPQCARLEAKLEVLEQERRELSQENRQLWKENARIREQLAFLEGAGKGKAAVP